MKTACRICHVLMVVSLMMAGIKSASARILEHWPIDYLVLKADLIVQGRVERNYVIVDKVILGQSSPGARVAFTTFMDLKFRVCSHVEILNGENDCRDVTGSPAVVFLQHRPDSWEVMGEASGLKWLDGQRVLGYYQFQNPGAAELMEEPEAKTPQELDRVIKAALVKREQYLAAVNDPDPQKRIRGLRPFLAEGNRYYGEEVLHSLAGIGPPAGKVLRELAEEPSDRRSSIIAAMGDAGDPDCVPFLARLVENGRAFVTEAKFTLAPADPRRTLNEWQTALCALAKIDSPKAHSILLESISEWQTEPSYGPTAGFCIEKGLNKYPRAEDVAYFQKAYPLYPRWYAWQGSGPWASWQAMNFLAAHKFKEAIPLLVEQLDHSDPATKDWAARLLREIVGSDLGKSKEPWMNWYTSNQKRN